VSDATAVGVVVTGCGGIVDVGVPTGCVTGVTAGGGWVLSNGDGVNVGRGVLVIVGGGEVGVGDGGRKTTATPRVTSGVMNNALASRVASSAISGLSSLIFISSRFG
jgi:hypothetical protein